MGIENAILIGLSRQVALRSQMDMVANNIANMNTTAYKSRSLLFREVLVQTEQGDAMSYVEGYGTLRDTSEGPIRPTGNPLDLAISGPGYLVVETDDGEQYTRGGQLRLDDEGILVTQDGDPVLDEDGKEIEFADASADVFIAKDGTITAGDGEQFRLSVVGFRNEQALEAVEGGLYKAEEQPEPIELPAVLQGKIEGSNVQPIVQMTRMIDVQRAYESMQSMITTDNDLQKDAIGRLGAIA
jgi:flagellar basal-body rod protein FlgF